MPDVIYISSSEDEDSAKKQSENSNASEKRRLNLNEKENIKRIKVENVNEFACDSNKSNENFNSANLVSSEKSENACDNTVCEQVSLTVGLSQEKSEVKECSPLSKPSQQTNPVKKVIKPQLVVREKVPIPEPPENVFMVFLEVCEQKKPCEETKKILIQLKTRYDQLNSTDKDDKEFKNLLSTSLQKILNDHNDVFYMHIQELDNEIKHRIHCSKISASLGEKSNAGHDAEQENVEQENVEEDAEGITLSEDDRKRVKKLQKVIQECHRRIKVLEEKEVDFNDDENSAYIQVDRFKKKLVELYYELNNIIKDRTLKKEIFKRKIRLTDIPTEMTGILSVDEAIIKSINSNIQQLNKLKHIKNPNAVADCLELPDYNDILDCIEKCNEQTNLELNKKRMEQLAKTAFKSVCSYLKKQRVRESREFMQSLVEVGVDADPAAQDPELNQTLQINKKDGDQRLEAVFQKYAEMEENNVDQNNANQEDSENSEINDSIGDNVDGTIELDEGSKSDGSMKPNESPESKREEEKETERERVSDALERNGKRESDEIDL